MQCVLYIVGCIYKYTRHFVSMSRKILMQLNAYSFIERKICLKHIMSRTFTFYTHFITLGK